MYCWPNDYPPLCPPEDAVDLAGTIYRFINRNSPVENDFLSHYERNPQQNWGDKSCQAHGLSVLKTLPDCREMQKGVPALRKKRIAVGEINQKVGVIIKTPSSSCGNHCTWWRSVEPSQLLGFFSTLDE